MLSLFQPGLLLCRAFQTLPFCLVTSNALPALLQAHLLRRGELRRCQALHSPRKSRQLLLSSSPPWGPSGPGQARLEGRVLHPWQPQPSRSVLTPCPSRHRSPLNQRRGSMGRDRAKSAIDPFQIPQPAQNLAWSTVKGVLGASGLGLQTPESTPSLRGGGTQSSPAPFHSLGEPLAAHCGPSRGQHLPPWPGSRTIRAEWVVNEEEGKTNDASSK